MAMDSGLRRDMTEFLIELPLLQSKEGRQAALLRAGLQEALPHIDLSGSPYECIARLIDRLEIYTTLSDGQFALICFLQEIGNQLGQDRREILHTFCQQLQIQLKSRPIASLSYQRPISYLAPFQAPPLPQHFVPRPEVTDALKACLLNNEPITPGILVVSAIHGLGGIGKSTLAAALAYDQEVQKRFPDGILWATLGQQPEILSLISGWIHALRDYDFRPTTIEAASAHLRTLLQDKAVLLVVDDVWNPEHAIHFKVGGPHCQVLITTRRADVADEVGAELHQMDVMTPEQSLDLLAARLQRPLEAVEREEALSLAKAVGYLPLALELAASRVKDGTSWKNLYEALKQEIARLEELASPTERLLKGESKLEASFNLSLKALRDKNEKVWEAFVWLGIVPEDVQISVPMATTLWNLNESTTDVMLKLFRDNALLMLGPQFVIGEKEWPSYRLHDLFHDIARKMLITPQPQGLGITIQNAHAALLERYKQHTQNDLWHTLPDDGYIHAHLTWHFQQAGQEEQIHALLREETEEGRNGWYQARERLGQTAGFLADVTLAWKLVKKEVNIGLQCRYMLIVVSFNSLAQNLTPTLMKELVESGLWTSAQGLAYARQIPSQEQRVETLIKLIPHLKSIVLQETLQEALITAQKINLKETRVGALIGLLPHLPERLRKKTVQEALATAQAIEYKETRVKALTRLLPHLPERLRKKTLQEALITAQKINLKETRGELEALTGALNLKKPRIEALTVLLPYLPERLREKTVQKALATAQKINLKEMRVGALIGLLPYLPERLREKTVQEALATTQAIAQKETRVKVLTELLPHLPERLRKKTVQEALATVQTIEERKEWIGIVTELLPHLPSSLKEKKLRRVLMRAQIIEDKKKQIKAFVGMAAYLPEPLLQDALIAVKTIEEERNWAAVLVQLAAHLPASLLQEALLAVQAIEDEWIQAKTLAGLAPYLPEMLLKESLLAAQAIKGERARAEALVGLAAHLPEPLLKETLLAVKAIMYKKGWVKTLIRLTPSQLEPLRDTTWREALAAAQTIMYKRDYAKALAKLTTYRRKNELRKALIAAKEIENEKIRAGMLTELVPYLPEPLLLEALANVRIIWDEKIRAETLTRFVPYLPEFLREKVLREALTAAQTVWNEKTRVELLASLVSSLPEPLLRKTLLAVLTIWDGEARIKALARLTPYLPQSWRENIFREIVVAAQTIDNGGTRAKALAELISYLPEPLKEKIGLEALVAVKTISGEDKAEALAGLAPHLPEELLSKALSAALEIPDDVFGFPPIAKALTGLAPYLSKELFPEALKSALTSRKERTRVRILIGLAPHLPDELLIDALTAAQAVEDKWGQVEALTALFQRLIELPTTELLSLWHDLLEHLAQCSRSNLLSNLSDLTPVIAKLGGEEAIVELFHAIQNVGRWWP